MAIENDDLLVLQKNTGGELRKATIGALLAEVTHPDIPNVISDLSDVSDTVAGNGQVLAWNGTEWAPANETIQNLDNYLTKPGEEGDFVVSEAADGTITYTAFSDLDIDAGEY